VYKTVQGECKSVDSLTVGNGERNSYSKLSKVTILRIFIMLMRMGLHQARHLDLKGEACSWGNNAKERIMLACSADGSDRLAPVVIGTGENHCCFKNVRKLPTKYVASRKAWVTQSIFTDYLRTLYAKMYSQNKDFIFTFPWPVCCSSPRHKLSKERESCVVPPPPPPQTALVFSNHLARE
jgi:hypothetical protein